VGTQITEAALSRKDSRGGHYNLDFPHRSSGYEAKEASSSSKGSPLGRPKFRRPQGGLGKEGELLVRGGSPTRVRPQGTVSRSQKEDQ